MLFSGESYEQGNDHGRGNRGNSIDGCFVYFWPVRNCEEYARQQERGGEGSLVASRHCAATPRRFDPQSGGDRKGLRTAGSNGVWRYREGALGAAFRGHAAGKDCGQWAARWSDWTPAGGG